MDQRAVVIDELISDLGAVRRAFVARDPALHFGLTPAQKELLRLCKIHADGLHVKDIARAMHISSSAATQQIDILVRGNLLERTKSQQDRRSVEVRLTPASARMVEAVQAQVAAHFTEILTVLSDTELYTFRDIIRKLAINIEKS